MMKYKNDDIDSNKAKSNKVKTIETVSVWTVELSKKNAISDNLLDTLYTKEEILLLNEWISPHEIKMINKLFGKKYIIAECNTIINRLQKYNMLLQRIEWHDQQYKDFSLLGIIATWGYLDEPYNSYENRSYAREKLAPNNERIDDWILVDLFSQWKADMLYHSLDEEKYLFNPQNMIYVDIFNKDSNTINSLRWINDIRIKDDSLRFTALLPDNSVNYVVSGIDDCIIKESTTLGWLYLDYLTDEICRTTKKGWIVTWIKFQRNDILKKKWMNSLLSEKDIIGFYCYEKK